MSELVVVGLPTILDEGRADVGIVGGHQEGVDVLGGANVGLNQVAIAILNGELTELVAAVGADGYRNRGALGGLGRVDRHVAVDHAIGDMHRVGGWFGGAALNLGEIDEVNLQRAVVVGDKSIDIILVGTAEVLVVG